MLGMWDGEAVVGFLVGLFSGRIVGATSTVALPDICTLPMHGNASKHPSWIKYSWHEEPVTVKDIPEHKPQLSSEEDSCSPDEENNRRYWSPLQPQSEISMLEPGHARIVQVA